MAKRAATDGEIASGLCCSGMACLFLPMPDALPPAWLMVLIPEIRFFSGDGTSTGRLGVRIVLSVLCGVRGLVKACDRCLESVVAGVLSSEVLRLEGLWSITGVVGGVEEYLCDRGRNMWLLTMALMRLLA